MVLNGQRLSLTYVEAGVPPRSILGSLFFLIYMNGLSDGLTSNQNNAQKKKFSIEYFFSKCDQICSLFADDTSLFSVVQNISSTANDLNS